MYINSNGYSVLLQEYDFNVLLNVNLYVNLLDHNKHYFTFQLVECVDVKYMYVVWEYRLSCRSSL